MEDFTNRFSNYSNEALLQVIENADRYQPVAVEAAQKILASRELSPEELQVTKAKIASENEKEALQTQKNKELKGKANTIIGQLAGNLSPIQIGSPSTNRTINALSIFFMLGFFYKFYSQFSLLHYMFTSSDAKWDLGMIVYLFDLLIPAIGVCFFWRRNKTGWMLLTASLTFSIIISIKDIWQSFARQSNHHFAIDALFPQPPVFVYVIVLLFFLALLLIISDKKIREVFGISRNTMWLTILICTFAFYLLFRFFL